MFPYPNFFRMTYRFKDISVQSYRISRKIDFCAAAGGAPPYKTCRPMLRMSRIAIASSLQWVSGKDVISKVVEAVDIEPKMYGGSDRKSVVASSCERFPPYFYFRFGRKRQSETCFRSQF